MGADPRRGDVAGEVLVDPGLALFNTAHNKLMYQMRMGTVMATLSGFFTALRDQLNADTFSTLSNLRRDTRCFGRTTTLSDYDLADLGHLCSQYAPLVPEQAAALQAALDSAVICNSSRQADAHGLSIYSPYYNKTAYGNSWLAAGRELNFSGAYSSWISRYASFWLGDQLADWTGLAGRALPAAEDGSQTLELDLTRDQEAHFADARVVILRDQGYDNAYFKVFEIADLRPEEGVLRARYDFSGMCWTKTGRSSAISIRLPPSRTGCSR